MKDKLRDFKKMSGRVLISLLLRLLFLVPVRKDQLFFSSFHDQKFGCNPKYIYRYFRAHYPSDYRTVWAFEDLSKRDLVPGSIVVAPKTFRYFLERSRSRVIVNNVEDQWYYPKRRSQILLQTWHGGGAYKRVGIAAGYSRRVQLEQKLNSRKIDYYISSSEKFREVQSESKCVPIKKFIATGMPRNSLLLLPRYRLSREVREIRQRMGVTDESEQIFLYAPTYRGIPESEESKEECDAALDWIALGDALKMRFPGKWRLFIRGHYYQTGAERKDDSVADLSYYEDMQELLLVADVLLTDYSSSMWDFSLTGRPCFLFAPDIDRYIEKRGFYTSPEEWPFPIARNNDELTRLISDFSEEKYRERVAQHHLSFGSVENVDAAQLVAETLIPHLTPRALRGE